MLRRGGEEEERIFCKVNFPSFVSVRIMVYDFISSHPISPHLSSLHMPIMEYLYE